MGRRLTSIAVLAAVLPVSGCGDSSPASGSDGASISVHATRDALPVSGALVLLTSSGRGDSLVAAATTDASGNAMLLDVDDGLYVLEVSKTLAGQVIYGLDEDLLVSGGPGEDRTIPLDSEADSYFPLVPGNTWTYSFGADSTMTIGVYSTVDVYGRSTYTLGPAEGAHPPYFTCGVTRLAMHGYETIDGDDFFFTAPRTFADFAATPGRTWVIPAWGSVTLEEAGLSVTVPAGTFLECARIRMDKGGSPDWVWWCAPGVGAVKVAEVGGLIGELIEYELH